MYACIKALPLSAGTPLAAVAAQSVSVVPVSVSGSRPWSAAAASAGCAGPLLPCVLCVAALSLDCGELY